LVMGFKSFLVGFFFGVVLSTLSVSYLFHLHLFLQRNIIWLTWFHFYQVLEFHEFNSFGINCHQFLAIVNSLLYSICSHQYLLMIANNFIIRLTFTYSPWSRIFINIWLISCHVLVKVNIT
jgi:hypothetical protein